MSEASINLEVLQKHNQISLLSILCITFFLKLKSRFGPQMNFIEIISHSHRSLSFIEYVFNIGHIDIRLNRLFSFTIFILYIALNLLPLSISPSLLTSWNCRTQERAFKLHQMSNQMEMLIVLFMQSPNSSLVRSFWQNF